MLRGLGVWHAALATLAGMSHESPALSERVRAFVDAPRFAALATVDPDGGPRQAVAWYRIEPDGRILVNSRRPRRWPANVERTRHVAIAIVDPTNGNRWVGLTADLDEVIEGEQARDDIVDLAYRYNPGGPDEAELADFRTQPRVTFLLRITGVHDHLDG